MSVGEVAFVHVSLIPVVKGDAFQSRFRQYFASGIVPALLVRQTERDQIVRSFLFLTRVVAFLKQQYHHLV
jgi:hypothetical protein